MNQITLQEMNKKFNELNEKFEKLKEDLIVAKRVEEAYLRHEEGEFVKMSKEEFLQELDRW